MEILGLYDSNGTYLNETILRKDKNKIPLGKYYKVIILFIINKKGEFLIQKSSKIKGGLYETLGGHVIDNFTSIETIVKELKEELSLEVPSNAIKYFKKYIYGKAIQEIYYINYDVDIDKLKLNNEVDFVKWYSKEKIKKIIKKEQFRKKNIVPFLELVDWLVN